MATKKVKTNELKVTYPGGTRRIVWCVGSVKSCAEYAATDIQRELRRVKAIGSDDSLPDAELDKLEADLLKHREAEAHGYKFAIVSEEEEYEIDKDDDAEDEGDEDEDEE